MVDRVRLQRDDFLLDEELGWLKMTSARIGGVVFFLGCARDFSEGRCVSQLSFEAYEPMALAEMRRLREEAIKLFSLIDVRIVHRVGSVAAGDNIVLIVVGAEHRGPAFDACEWLIDSLKQQVPIWKKEITPSGDSWVSPHP